MIRVATNEDKPELHRMGREFYNASGYSDVGEWSPEVFDNTLDLLIDAGTLLIAPGGMIGWVNFPVFMTGQQVAQELFWWVDPDKRDSGLGRELLAMAETKAKDQGSSKMMMLCLDELEPEKAVAMYAKMGYVPRERTFMRSL